MFWAQSTTGVYIRADYSVKTQYRVFDFQQQSGNIFFLILWGKKTTTHLSILIVLFSLINCWFQIASWFFFCYYETSLFVWFLFHADSPRRQQRFCSSPFQSRTSIWGKLMLVVKQSYLPVPSLPVQTFKGPRCFPSLLWLMYLCAATVLLGASCSDMSPLRLTFTWWGCYGLCLT